MIKEVQQLMNQVKLLEKRVGYLENIVIVCPVCKDQMATMVESGEKDMLICLTCANE